MKKNKLYLWQDEEKISITPMDYDANSNSGYNPEINAQIVAKMFGCMLPGNTNEIIYHAIAKRMMQILGDNRYRDDYTENDIAYHVQSAISSLLSDEEE